jgi:hypothetical protein
MKKFKPGDFVTPTISKPIYYHRYYYNGTYGDFYRGRIIKFEPSMIGIVRSIAPSVWEHASHKEFLVIDFCEPITGEVQRVSLHHSEAKEAEPLPYTISCTGEPIPAEAFIHAR